MQEAKEWRTLKILRIRMYDLLEENKADGTTMNITNKKVKNTRKKKIKLKEIIQNAANEKREFTYIWNDFFTALQDEWIGQLFSTFANQMSKKYLWKHWGTARWNTTRQAAEVWE